MSDVSAAERARARARFRQTLVRVLGVQGLALLALALLQLWYHR